MSPVSRRRTPKSVSRRRPVLARSSRRAPALDILTRELVKLAGVTDAFTVEGVGTFLFDVLDQRGPAPDDTFASFCLEALSDERAPLSSLGVQSLLLIRALGPRDLSALADAAIAVAPADVVAALPHWHDKLGAVHLVEGGALRTADGRESVLHLMVDYDQSGAGSRHLLTVGIDHPGTRVHLLDLRGRGSDDSLAPVAEQYSGADDPAWTWLAAEDVAPLVTDAVCETGRHVAGEWPVLGLDEKATVAWTLGVRRLEQLSGVDLAHRTSPR